MATLLLSVKGAFAEFERALNAVERAEARAWVAAGEQKAAVARAYGISRETLYQYLRMAEDAKELIGGETQLLS